MGYPPFQIPKIEDATVEGINNMVNAINRALMDIYRDKPDMTGTFTVISGSQLTIQGGFVKEVK